ncbi:P-II family nitrogen regulator [Lachnospiraceae bacterium NSJ-143]|nr:P-II family nitrogen regulator [Lachnospiraceae bacterium NSJ-143]
MSELYMMVTITERNTAKKFVSLYSSYGADVTLSAVGLGTAVSETLDYLGLEKTEKIIIISVVTGTVWKAIKTSLQNKLKIDVPGTGIAFIIPISSIGGKKPLFFLTENQNFEKGEESSLKDTKYELLVVIANQGYTDIIMDAAREENAGGGTVIHAKGTGMEKAEKFLGVSLVNEKEMVFIVVKSGMKNRIMKAIMDKAGLKSKAQSIMFSLPVTSTAGMRLMEEVAEDSELTEA